MSAIHTWRQQILKAVDDQGHILLSIIPDLAQIIGVQPPVPNLNSIATKNRFRQVLNQFVRVFTKPKHPLVLFLDDLQWADLDSLQLLQQLTVPEASTLQGGHLLIIGTYRDNEAGPNHPLTLIRQEICQQKTGAYSHLTLEPLTPPDITNIVADTLRYDVETAYPLSEFVYLATQGNPFFTTQFLQGLQTKGLIYFVPKTREWNYNLEQSRHFALTDDVVNYLQEQTRGFPAMTQRVLKIAACLGQQFELDIVAMICNQSSDWVVEQLRITIREGLIIPDSRHYQCFYDTTKTHCSLDRSAENKSCLSFCSRPNS